MQTKLGGGVGQKQPYCQKCKMTEDLHINSVNKKSGRISYMCNDCNTERCKKYRKTKEGKKNIYKAVYKSTKKFQDKQNARMSLNYHLKKGNIIKSTICIVCLKDGKLEAHHDDYSKPLKVKWVHRKCHAKLHKKNAKIQYKNKR